MVTGENTSTTLASPADIERVEFPALDAYSDIVHAGGKIHMAHMCGTLHRVVDALARTRLDGLHDVAPAPTGDLDFKADRQRLLAAGKCVAGGIDATAFVNPSPEAIERYVIARLAEAAPGVGFLLSSGDTVPLGTEVETLRRIVRTLERHGNCPLGA